MLIIDYSLDMFRASLCPSSGEKTTCYCVWGIFAVTREDMDISRVVETVVNNQHPELTINHLFCCILLVHALLTMHGHRNIKLHKVK